MKAKDQSGAQSAAADAARWAALRERKAQPELLYGVQTTKIFCRAGCRSRLPHRRNVVFFNSPRAAVAAGFRPCKRCQPQGPEPGAEVAERLARACRLLEQGEPRLDLKSVARSVGMSPFHFHRQFKALVGLTPKQYQVEHRLECFRGHLRQSGDVTSAVYKAGFGSASRAYEQVSRKLGMSPSQYRNGGAGLEIFYDLAQTALGLVLVAATGKGVCGVALGERREQLVESLRTDFPRAKLHHDGARLVEHMERVKEYARRPKGGLDLRLDLPGTAFQRRVWAALRRIPVGQTLTYQQLARRVGKPKGVRAVASACAANRVALGVPCHRVVRSDGSLGGYRWGLERKDALLIAERA